MTSPLNRLMVALQSWHFDAVSSRGSPFHSFHEKWFNAQSVSRTFAGCVWVYRQSGALRACDCSDAWPQTHRIIVPYTVGGGVALRAGSFTPILQLGNPRHVGVSRRNEASMRSPFRKFISTVLFALSMQARTVWRCHIPRPAHLVDGSQCVEEERVRGAGHHRRGNAHQFETARPVHRSCHLRATRPARAGHQLVDVEPSRLQYRQQAQ
jgi:hypothetical protein